MSTQNEKGTALITGASSGIGATYAERLARRGYDLLLVARDLARLEALGARLTQAYGVKIDAMKADLTDSGDIQTVSQRLRSDKAISLLVNNAGMTMNGKLADADAATVDHMILLNVVSLTHLSAAASANFTAAGRGAIINIASVVALVPEMFNAVYSATKAYVLSLTQTLDAEVKAQGV